MINFADYLVKKIEEMDNPTVVGLDPKLEYIPDSIKDYSEQLSLKSPQRLRPKQSGSSIKR